MRFVVRHFTVVTCAGLLALTVAGCGQGSSEAGKKPAAKIQGELITPGATATAQPKESAVTTSVAPPPLSMPAAAVSKTPAPLAAEGEYAAVGFDKLASYNFDVPDDAPITNQPAGPDKADE